MCPVHSAGQLDKLCRTCVSVAADEECFSLLHLLANFSLTEMEAKHQLSDLKLRSLTLCLALGSRGPRAPSIPTWDTAGSSAGWRTIMALEFW